MSVRAQTKLVKTARKPGSAQTALTGITQFPVVAIGASAGGLEALVSFFKNLSSDTGMAFVVIQHMDPTHKSLLSELIARHTKMAVSEISNGQAVRPNCVYVIPSNKDLTIKQNVLKLTKPGEERSKRRPIDRFFSSLAKDQKNHAIGIVLSGTGTEGAKGLEEIRANGGMTIVQDPSTAQFAGMPENVISAGVADHILAPDKMPAILKKEVKDKTVSFPSVAANILVSDSQLKQIIEIIRNDTGYDFSSYKPNTIIRRLQKRISFKKSASADMYIKVLKTDKNEILKLYHEFLIGVTSFFRDEAMFHYFGKNILPYIVKKCVEKKEIRVWVCGCSTGEEAYSYAILFREWVVKEKPDMKVVIFASDLNKDFIAFARKGKYPGSISNTVSSGRLSQFFDKQGTDYQLRKEIRDMVVFANHNVIHDPPFSKMDIISCRNLLIYMNSDLQRKIIQNFHYSLNNDGILILGPSESIGRIGNQFSTLDEKLRIFKKKTELSRKNSPGFELSFVKQKKDSSEPELISAIMKKSNISGITDKILLDQYAPPSVIIDRFNEIRYFSGNTGAYLEPPTGIAKFDLLEMARKGLRPGLEEAIKKARKTKNEVQTKNIEVLFDDYFKTTRLKIKPLLSKEYDPGTLMIIFEPVEIPAKESAGKKNGLTLKEKQKMGLLEKELKMTKQHLQIAINELETSREDFNCSKEELQSSNEELETSREELQAVNEELITVNTELTGKIDQLSESNNDLTNLLKCIEVATVYLDRDLLIKRFTPAATRIFNLIPADIDRSLVQLSGNLQYKNLVEDVKLVLKTLIVKSIEVIAKDGTWYFMRIIPYRTAENSIEGVLVTLVDITNQKQAQQELGKANEQLQLIMEKLPVIPFTAVVKPETGFHYMGKSAEKITGFLPERFTERFSFWANRIHTDDKKKTLAAFADISSKASHHLFFRWKCADGEYRQFMISKRYVTKTGSRPGYITGVWQDAPPLQ